MYIYIYTRTSNSDYFYSEFSQIQKIMMTFIENVTSVTSAWIAILTAEYSFIKCLLMKVYTFSPKKYINEKKCLE